MSTTLDRLTAALAGRYDVSKEIGAGGMATVFLGHDLKHDRDVAIKVLHPDLGAALGSERFLSEIKTTAKLQHPHILPLLDSGEADGLLYYVMPVVTGEALRVRLEREGQLSINESVRIAKEVASALDYAHRHGVIHRDIKPENILLHDGQALVADFGIALAVSAASGARMTQTGLSLGTPQYMSPEQAMGERTVDARSDVYSLGAVTYEMLTGDPPFTGNSVQAIVSKVMTQRPTPIPALRETVPQTVEDAVMIALAKLPADRFATAAEFATALSTPTTAFSRPEGAELAGAGRRGARLLNERLVIPLAAFALIATALALWGWLRPAPPRPVIRSLMSFDSTDAPNGVSARMAISADGSTIVYAGGPQLLLYVRHRNDLRSSSLPGTDGALAPVLSPDGRQIAYTTVTSALKVVSLNGGPPITINDSAIGRSGSAWGPDGYIYLPDRSATELVRLRPEPRSAAERVTVLDTASGEVAHRLPDVLPNGRGILFTVYYGGKGRTGTAVAVADLATHKHTIVVAGAQGRYSPSGHLLYVTENGTLMAAPFDQRSMKVTGESFAIAEGLRRGSVGQGDLAVSRNGTLLYALGGSSANAELVWVTRDGKASPVDSTWRAEMAYPSLSPDGKHVAVSVGQGVSGDVWTKQLDHGPSLKLTFEGSANNYPTWSADGKNITYYSNARSGTVEYDLWTKRADGSAQAVLQLHWNKPLAEPLWSRDGKWLIFRTFTTAAGLGDIYAMRPGVDSTPVAIATTRFTEQSPTLSPDGRWLAYSSNETGHDEIYVVPFPNAGSAKWPVSTHGGSEPRWSNRGGELFYRDGSGNMVVVDVKTSPTFSFGTSKILFPATTYFNFPSHRQYDVSPDDRRFIMVRSVGSVVASKVVVIDNWFEELKRAKR